MPAPPPPPPPPPPPVGQVSPAPAAVVPGGVAQELAAAHQRLLRQLEPEPEPEPTCSSFTAAAAAAAAPTALDAAQGLLVGLAAGDRNRGPIQMCVALAESVVDRGSYDPAAALQRYRGWWKDGQGDDAWDTGPTTLAVLEGTTDSCTLTDAEQAAMAVDSELAGQTAGVNAAHRVLALALARSALSDEADLLAAARQESRLTHWSPISQHTCALLCYLARGLLEGRSLEQGISQALAMEAALAPDEPAVCKPLRELLGGRGGTQMTQSDLQNDGFCPNVRPFTLQHAPMY
jgi:hypothetical protein